MQGTFNLVQQQEFKDEKWSIIGKFTLSDNRSIRKIVDIAALEAFDLFVFLVIDFFGASSILFYDLSGCLIFSTGMGKLSDPVCFNIDQRRRELLIGVKSGRILCYFINTIKSSNNAVSSNLGEDPTNFRLSPAKGFKKTRIISAKRSRPSFQMTMRAKAWVPASIGKHAAQLESVDLLGFFLVLSDEGGIACFNSSLFEVIYLIPSERFALTPTKIWSDKFGSDFVVLCKNADKTAEVLEYWRYVATAVSLFLSINSSHCGCSDLQMIMPLVKGENSLVRPFRFKGQWSAWPSRRLEVTRSSPR